MTDPVCPKCGQKVLTVATRCPHCGLPFEAQFYQRPSTGPRSRRISPGLIVAGVVVTLVVANALRQQITSSPRITPPPGPTALAPRDESPARPPNDAAIAAADTLPTVAAPSPKPLGESPPPAPEAVDSAPSRANGVDPVVGLRRYASTWINVRAGRSSSARVLRILNPGEAVQVDSLRQGWYRLVSEQPPAGYADSRLLDSLPPASAP